MTTFAVRGDVDEGFGRVADAFAANFDAGLEVGASFAVEVDGRLVVDLRGGHADAARTREWQGDTLVNVWSTTKGLAALCIAMLVDRGLLKYAQPVAEVWPEFAAAGKEDLTVEEVLSHQGGLAGATVRLEARDFANHDAMARLLAAQAPMFPRGQCGYHAITQGFLTGELVRRVADRSLGRFFADEVAGPLGADAWIGLPRSEDARVAEILPPPPGPQLPPPRDPVALAALANPPLDRSLPNKRWWRECEIPSVNAQTNARALARIYGMLACGGEADGRRYLSRETIAEATRIRLHAKDLVLRIPMRWAAGFSRNDGVTWGPNRANFGHSGWGGSFGCADPDARLSMGYAMNRMQDNLRGDPRTLALIAAVYESLGAA